MNNQDWEILDQLSRHLNITKAAENMQLSQSTITKRLKQMEAGFDVRIVFRGKKGIHFTPEGEYLADSARSILKEYEVMKDTLWNMEEEVKGTIKIAVSNFLTSFLLFNVIRAFKEKYPEVDFQITTGWSRDMYDQVRNDDVHVSFIRGDYQWQGRKHLLFEETLCIASKQPIPLAELPAAPRIDYKKDIKLDTMISSWWDVNFREVPRISMVMDKAESCREMIRNGLGYSIVTSLVVRNMEDIHKTEVKDRDGQLIRRGSWMFCHEKSLKLKAVRKFVEFIESYDPSRG
ncbi:MAG: LysR family transcriptional regulator [Bhargavaea sp.]